MPVNFFSILLCVSKKNDGRKVFLWRFRIYISSYTGGEYKFYQLSNNGIRFSEIFRLCNGILSFSILL